MTPGPTSEFERNCEQKRNCQRSKELFTWATFEGPTATLIEYEGESAAVVLDHLWMFHG